MNNDQKIRVIHFNNGSGGGTFSVVKNLLKFSDNPAIENHVIFTINKGLVPEFEIPLLEGAASSQVFYYFSKWNFYYTCRQLAKLLPDDKSVIVAHDWLELGMVSNLGLLNPVVQMVHGNYSYYYELAKKHELSINQFITVSPVIYKKLCLLMPNRICDINYGRFPVPEVDSDINNSDILKIFYCVRTLDDENKQFKILPRINAALKLKGITVLWTIIGKGVEMDSLSKVMGQDTGISLFPHLPNEKVLSLLPSHDLFILPSFSEGFPVSVVEAMKGGVVPLVTNWGEATGELIIDGETGYYFETTDAEGYASTIAMLNNDRILLHKIAEAGKQKANELFDPFTNTKIIEELLIKSVIAINPSKSKFKVYGSRLDQEWVPNFVTKIFRSF